MERRRPPNTEDVNVLVRESLPDICEALKNLLGRGLLSEHRVN